MTQQRKQPSKRPRSAPAARSLDVAAAYPWALTPTLTTPQQGLQTLDRLCRYHFALLGDCWELGLAQWQANLSARTPVELSIKTAALTTQFSAKQQHRLREWLTSPT